MRHLISLCSIPEHNYFFKYQFKLHQMMWKLILILFLPIQVMAQQGIAINSNGTLPSPAAILDVNSTTKGLLIPRMSQSQRMGISTPENGLLVFENDNQRLFQYRDGTWRFLLNDNYWIKSTTRKWMINFFDSIGIGTAAPNERFHISNGNFRLLSGDLKVENGDFTMNNTTGIIQLRAGGENKTFIQVAVNDIRLGVNAENAFGKVRFTNGGITKVTIDNGDLALNLNNRLTRPETGEYDLLPYCYGQVDVDGSIMSGSGNFQVTFYSLLGVYEYRIKVDGLGASTFPFPEPVIIVTNTRGTTGIVPAMSTAGDFDNTYGHFVVKLFNDNGNQPGAFNFVVYKK